MRSRRRRRRDARVVYVDSDPVVCSHAQALLADNEQTIAIRADIRQPGEIIDNEALRKLIDLDQPVAILLLTVLHSIPDDHVAERVIAELRSAMTSGSYLAIQHAVSDTRPEVTQSLTSLYQDEKAITGSRRARNTRTKAKIESFFDGLELVDPGVVYLPTWRPEPGIPVAGSRSPSGSWAAWAARTELTCQRAACAAGPDQRTAPWRTVARTQRSEFFEDLAEDFGGAGGGLGLQAQTFHHREVVVHVISLVQIESTGELFEVDHIRQIGLGETQDAERAASGSVTAGMERNYLESDISHRRDLDEMLLSALASLRARRAAASAPPRRPPPTAGADLLP